MKFDPEGMSDDEVVDTLVGRKVTFSGYMSDRDDEVVVRSDCPRPEIKTNDRGRYMSFFAPEGRRHIQVEKISAYSRKKY